MSAKTTDGSFSIPTSSGYFAARGRAGIEAGADAVAGRDAGVIVSGGENWAIAAAQEAYRMMAASKAWPPDSRMGA